HCCVPFCSASSKCNSFHSFPTDSDLRKQWLINIRRDPYTVTAHTKVCSGHFTSDQLIEPTSLTGGRRLVKGAVPTLFQWNICEGKTEPPPPPQAQEWHSLQKDHNYCFIPGPPAKKRSFSSELDKSISATEDQSKYVKNLRKKIWEQFIQQEFCLQRFAGSDDDIQFYTRQHLQPVDEFFLFLIFLSLGMKERDLAIRFNTHQSIVSLVIATWTNFLFTVLGSQCIWLTQQQVQAYLPEEFKDFPDTHVILDCTELRCQIPLPQMDINPTHRSLCTMRALVGIAPHGAVTFVSDLYRGSFSNSELFKCSGIAENLTEDMAVMVNKGFLIRDCCECKVYPLSFLSKHPGDQATARLKMHVEQVIGRVKQNKLFHGIVSLSQAYNINQLFVVSCLLSNYQN
uniref:THAP-type domain-containing protein n=1 Tax=Poecilia reticulata TaxID=8081 RepID=A0A3P9PJI4_POERE